MSNIGIDLDGTLIEFLTGFKKQIAMDFKIKEKDLPQQIDYFWSNFPQEFKNRVEELIEDPYFMGPENIITDIYTIDALLHFKEEGHKIIVITARSEKIRKQTEEIINRFFPNLIDKLILVKNVTDKKEKMIEEKINYWIDDAPHGCTISIELGLPTFLLYNKYTEVYSKSLFIKYREGIDFWAVKSIYEIYLKYSIFRY